MKYHTKWYCRVFIVYCCFVFIGCTEATIREENLTREEALNLFSMPLPESASNIYFYSQSGGLQGIIGFVRFDVAQEELHSTVEAIIERNNIQFRRELAYERRELSKIPEEEFSVPRACSKEAALDWWNPENITKGYYRGEIKSYAERLWIDEEHSRIYLFQLD